MPVGIVALILNVISACNGRMIKTTFNDEPTGHIRWRVTFHSHLRNEPLPNTDKLHQRIKEFGDVIKIDMKSGKCEIHFKVNP